MKEPPRGDGFDSRISVALLTEFLHQTAIAVRMRLVLNEEPGNLVFDRGLHLKKP